MLGLEHPHSLACGFCFAWPTLFILPILPVCAAVFVVWVVFRVRYEAGGLGRSAWWLISGAAIFLIGSMISIELWTVFLLFWMARVLTRIGSLNQEAEYCMARERDEANPDPPFPSSRLKLLVRTRAFHKRTLLLLAGAVGAKVLLLQFALGYSP